MITLWGISVKSGANEDRTRDLLHAMQALSQLSYGPKILDNIALGIDFVNATGDARV